MRTTGLGQSALLLLDAVEVLAREDVDYAVIGAMAAAIHGVVRASVDADVVLRLVSMKGPELQQAFESEGFQTEGCNRRRFHAPSRSHSETAPCA